MNDLVPSNKKSLLSYLKKLAQLTVDLQYEDLRKGWQYIKNILNCNNEVWGIEVYCPFNDRISSSTEIASQIR